jgi:hypothetical protein
LYYTYLTSSNIVKKAERLNLRARAAGAAHKLIGLERQKFVQNLISGLILTAILGSFARKTRATGAARAIFRLAWQIFFKNLDCTPNPR